ncbi:MAG: ribose-phosphate pyrophosphokinase [Deltaproteobacteria bacterium]|nr:ribose-phosphate pyrophosphokinase [Deltaproteobacteria bacterium]
MDKIKVFAGNSNRPLALEICETLGLTLGKSEVKSFSDGEVYVDIQESVRGVEVYVVQSTCIPCNNNLMELLIMLDAFKRASAVSVTAVLPYYGYARQDRKVAPRTPISAKLVADLITVAGATRVVCVDLHAGQIQGFFNIPVDHLYATPVLLKYIKDNFNDDIVIVSPDAGGVERARAFAKRLEASLAIIDKRRPAPNVSEVMNIIGDVHGKTAIILDDMIDTAGTLTQAAVAVEKHGAKQIFACATHAVLSGPAIERIDKSPIRQLVVTNTIPEREGARSAKIKRLSVGPLLGEAIKRIHCGESVSSLFV